MGHRCMLAGICKYANMHVGSAQTLRFGQVWPIYIDLDFTYSVASTDHPACLCFGKKCHHA